MTQSRIGSNSYEKIYDTVGDQLNPDVKIVVYKPKETLFQDVRTRISMDSEPKKELIILQKAKYKQ